MLLFDSKSNKWVYDWIVTSKSKTKQKKSKRYESMILFSSFMVVW